jgi:hypothetical protein
MAFSAQDFLRTEKEQNVQNEDISYVPTLPVQEEVDPFDEVLKERISVDTTGLSAFQKKFEEGGNFVTWTSDVLKVSLRGADKDSFLGKLQSIYGGRVEFRDRKTGEWTTPYFMTAEEKYGEDWSTLSDDEARERVKAFDAAGIDAVYGDVAETASPVAGAAGTFSKLLSDPSTLLPIGQTKLAAAAIGGTIGATDAALAGLAENGEVDMGTVLLGTVLGGTLGVVAKYAGDTFIPALKERIKTGQPFTPKEVNEHLDPRAFVGPDKIPVNAVEDFTTELNKRFNLTGEGYLKSSIRKINESPKGNEEALFRERLAAASQENLTEKQVGELAALDKDFTLSFGNKFTQFKERGPVDPKVFEGLDKPMPFKAMPPRKGKLVEDDKIITKRSDEKALDIINKEERGLSDSFREYIRKSKESGQVAPWLVRDLGFGAVGGLYGYAGEGDLESAMMWAIAGAAGAHAFGTFGPKMYEQVGKMLPYSADVTQEFADKWVRKTLAHKWRQRPSEYFKEVAGKFGARFNDLIQRMDEDIRSMMSNDLIDVKVTLDSLGIARKSDTYNNITTVLRDPKLYKFADTRTQTAVDFVRDKLDNVVKQAVKRGVISKKAGNEMIQKAKTEGYFPRVYNHFYLSSRKGQQEWFDVLSKHQWSKPQIKRAAKGIIGEDYRYKFTDFKSVKDPKTGEVKYLINRDFINRLYEGRNKATFTNRSTHLEKDRKIDLPDEVLSPFLINDLNDVLTSYFHDTYKRINGAKYFGAKSEGMFALQDAMKGAGVSTSDINDMWAVYKTAIGDPTSWVVKQMMNMPDEMRRAYSWLSALQTARLMFAQILNLTQATVNGMIFLSTRAPGGLQRDVIGAGAGFGAGEAFGLEAPGKIALAGAGASAARSGRLLLKGLQNTMTKEGRQFAERIGAASETTIMEAAGEMGALESRMATGFLKWTGFTGVEKFQRQFAANIGAAYAEELVERKSQLLAKSARGKLGRAGLKEIAKINGQMKEIGLNPRLRSVGELQKIGTLDMKRAAQRFSNKVNFINTPDRLPFIAQSPHAKIFRQFKTFMFHQGAFLNDNLLKPLKRGDARPIMAMAAAGGLGMAPSELRKWIKADDEDYTMLERYLQGFGAIGSLGLMYDLAQQGAYGEGGIAKALLGPTFATFGKVASGAYRTAEKAVLEQDVDFKPVAQSLINFPIIGQALDASQLTQQIGGLAGFDLSELPTKKELKELTSSKQSADPYDYYNNIYK